MSIKLPPQPDRQANWRTLQAWLRSGSILGALETLHGELGEIFRIPLPGFSPIFMVGPQANRFVFHQEKERLLWRAADDPVTKLLRHGLLVEDGPAHDQLRAALAPALQRRQLDDYVPAMVRCTDYVTVGWRASQARNMLDEMRRITLLILVETLFGVDFGPHMDRLWPAVLGVLAYISPGAWLVWPNLPRPQYRSAIAQMDDYLYGIIRERRRAPQLGNDMLSRLVANPDFSDDLIRDQLLTMLIAGHDTSTALLAWTLYLLGRHPQALAKAQAEVDAVVGAREPEPNALRQLGFLEQVIKESLRLYPPIHLGQRIAAADLTYGDYRIPRGARVIYSIYLTHRDPAHWPEPARFAPERFAADSGQRPAPQSYVPFGGGARNCIGAGFGLIEAKVVLARLLQQFELTLLPQRVHPHMGATLEPHPGVLMCTERRAI